ncbi:IS4 family transposase [Nocardia sp. NBC_01503]|uniref:IS4 family transposase n=1 Tax=Nocardia sp. NBC_01503 TaxID=2975997 RepID=UPI002E7BE022|nr:IS4 family transposase [Nocardia sp. NBC_01503]WTL31143.1 IS4 family transposase [Nocardia sp. NBC_01503]
MSVVAAGVFAPGHLGELTQIVPFEMVDAAVESGRARQTRVRDLPSRVVVYLLLAGALFTELGYTQVWARMVAGLDEILVARPGSSALAQARRRVGAAPLRELFGLLAGPAAGAARWRGLLVCAVDGTTMFVSDSAANAGTFARQGGGNGDSGYPMLRLLAVVACGTRTVIDVVFGTSGVSEIAYAPKLFRCLHERMLLLADRNFASAALIGQIAQTKADLLIRDKTNRVMPLIERLPDGSWLAVKGPVVLRVIDADIALTPKGGPPRRERYRLLTTLTDHHRYPAMELVRLYHQRWEIETTYAELKSTMLGGRVLRARTPAGIDQEVYALLSTYQALRIAIADATHPQAIPLQASFSIALNTARDQVVAAAAVIADTAVDLVGRIGRTVLADLLPARRPRQSPRVVKRAISKHRAKGAIDRTNYPTVTITINLRKHPS